MNHEMRLIFIEANAAAPSTIYNSTHKLVFFLITIAALCISVLILWSKKNVAWRRRVFWSSAAVVALSSFIASLPNWNQGLAVAGFALALLIGSAYFNTDYIAFNGRTYSYFLSRNEAGKNTGSKSPGGLTTARRFWTPLIGAVLLLSFTITTNLQPGGRPREAIVASILLIIFAAAFGYDDARNSHPVAGGQRIQFVIIGLLTVGTFPAIYLAAYFAGKQWPYRSKSPTERRVSRFR